MMAAFALFSVTMASELLTSTAPTGNVSVSMVMAENRFITSHDEVKEYVVKFLFCPDSSSNNTKAAQTHYNILHCITHLYPKAQVFEVTLNPQTTITPTPSVSSLPPEQVQAIVD